MIVIEHRLDAGGVPWARLPEEDKDELRRLLREHGLEPFQVQSVEPAPGEGGVPAMRCAVYACDGQHGRMCSCSTEGGPAMKWVTVVLDRPLPEWWRPA